MDEEAFENDLPHLVGQVTMLWSDIECWVDSLVQQFATAIDPVFDSDVARFVLLLPFRQLDLRRKIAVLKAMAHETPNSHADDFYARVEELLNLIDNLLRPERNRFIHGLWFGPDVFLRDFSSLRVYRPKAHAPSRLQTTLRHEYLDLSAVRSFRDHLIDMSHDLEFLSEYAAGICMQGRQREPLPPLPPEWKSSGRRAWQDVGTRELRPPPSLEWPDD